METTAAAARGPLLAGAWQALGLAACGEQVAQQWQDWLEQQPWCQGAAWARRDEIGLRLVNWVWAEWLLRLRWSGLGVGSLWRDGDRIDGPGHPADGTHAPFLGHHAPGLGRRIRSHSVRIRLEHEGSASLQTLIDLVPAGGTTRHPRAAIPAMPPA